MVKQMNLLPLMCQFNKEGWNGKFYIYVGSIYNCKRDFDKVYYQISDTLPYCKKVEE